MFACGFAATAILIYLFNAMLGRRLSPDDFSTFAAVLGVLLALNGPSTALFSGGAMAAARSGLLPRAPWRNALLAVAVVSLGIALVPSRPGIRLAGWFCLAAVMLMLVAWNRGLLIGVGRLGLSGGTMVVEGVARIAIALVLVSVGLGVLGASAGLALGICVGFLLTEALVPRRTTGVSTPVPPDVWASIVGLMLVGALQYIDVVAVRIVGGHHVGAYAAASSLARVAMYAQAPAAAFAIRRTAVAGPRKALPQVLLLALLPAVAAVAVLELFPGWVLSVTYGGHYLHAVSLVRVLTLAMFMAGAANVVIGMMLGAGRTAWVWFSGAVVVAGCALVFVEAHVAMRAAVAMVAVQAVLLVVVGNHARRLVAAFRAAKGSVLILNWRDTRHPQGGGSEVFVEEVARRLAAAGRPVTVFCAEHPNAPREEERDGVRFVRRGSWRTVYAWAAVYHVLGRFGPHEVVVDVQNAIPFFSPLYCGRPVVVLVHHVHREQWGMLFGARMARAGWWVESRLAPRLYRRASYVTVSDASREDLAALGIDRSRIAVVHNGSPEVEQGLTVQPERTAWPSVVYVGRLVPHKRVELLLEAVADLRPEFPGLRLRVVGQGLWEPQLRLLADGLALDGAVSFEGFVSEVEKREILSRSWLLALPSIKEGWGLAVVEAASCGTPSVAFRVGGLPESIADGTTGLLADDYPGFVDSVRRLLRSEALRSELGSAARLRARTFTWDATAAAVLEVIDGARVMPQAAAEPVPLPTTAALTV